jgi:hypothetical protein
MAPGLAASNLTPRSASLAENEEEYLAVSHRVPPPPCFSDVWQGKDLRVQVVYVWQLKDLDNR